MKQTSSVYKITLLLYVGVFLLPFLFYYNYQSLQTIRHDTSIIAKFSQVTTNIFTYQYIDNKQEKRKLTDIIEKNIQNITPWFMSSDNATFYVGSQSLQQDFTKFLKQWREIKENPSNKLRIQYSKHLRSINFILEKMMLLKHKHMENIFFIHMILSSIFLLLLIYFTRTYIYCQINKASVHDEDTKLFNHNYFTSQLTIAYAKQTRDKKNFTILSLYIHPDYTHLSHLNKKTRQDVLKRIGNILLTVTRVSDIACRCEEDLFAILLDNTDKESAQILEGRLKDKLNNDNVIQNHNIIFKYTIIEPKHETSPETMMKQIKESYL